MCYRSFPLRILLPSDAPTYSLTFVLTESGSESFERCVLVWRSINETPSVHAQIKCAVAVQSIVLDEWVSSQRPVVRWQLNDLQQHSVDLVPLPGSNLAALQFPASKSNRSGMRHTFCRHGACRRQLEERRISNFCPYITQSGDGKTAVKAILPFFLDMIFACLRRISSSPGTRRFDSSALNARPCWKTPRSTPWQWLRSESRTAPLLEGGPESSHEAWSSCRGVWCSGPKERQVSPGYLTGFNYAFDCCRSSGG